MHKKITILAEKLNNRKFSNFLNVEHTKDDETWHEQVNLIECLSDTLTEYDIPHQKFDNFITIGDDIYLQPDFIEFSFMNETVMKTSTKIDVFHQTHFPDGIFEYQHSFAPSIKHSITIGFSKWVELDLITILDALNGTHNLTNYSINTKDGERKRLMTFGAVSHYTDIESNEDEEHAFCPCCLFTNSVDAFKELLNDDAIFGIRFFVSRDKKGQISVDCRVNGLDFDLAKPLLMDYAQKWSDRGFEFRKQYVFITS